MPVALVTGASAGLGRALLRELSRKDWDVVVDTRDADALGAAVDGMPRAIPLPGDVVDPLHRKELTAAVDALGGLDLLVNNASTLGHSPLPRLGELSPDDAERLFRVNVLAPLALIRLVLPSLVASSGVVVNISSDAAVEAYPGWGGYGAAKAALEHLGAVLAAEQPGISVYALDPGDMRTAMHQAAFPGEDVSDRPGPEEVVPSVMAMLATRPASGRYRAAEFVPGVVSR
jgi:NAD(P)-dependent dehydrogenase (short-subunit alcohol dehydrogenase family)